MKTERARATAHVDTFAEDRLPPPEAMPELLFEGLSYPERLNAAGALLDAHVNGGGGDDRAILAPGHEPWSYAQLRDDANRIARVLVEDLGVEPGNRVLLRAPNSPMLAACWFAVIKAGAIAVTTMPLYRAGELRFMLEKAQVKHALCDARLHEELDTACESYAGLRTATFTCHPERNDDLSPCHPERSDELSHCHPERSERSERSRRTKSLETLMETKSPGFENAQTAAEDVALIAFTSGTTGTPKAAMHYHRDLLAICDTYCARVLRPKRDDLFCGSPPLGFTFGLGGMLLFPLYAGAATLLLEKAGPAEMLEAIAHYGVTTLFTAPVAYRTMARGMEGYDLSSLRTCVSAGETLPRAVWEEWRAKTGIKILDGIGSTEMLHIFVGSPEPEVRAGSTGRVVPGYVAEVHDDEGRPVPDGTIGRLAVKGPTGCKYLQDERQGAYVQRGWNYPGDAYRRDAGGYFEYVARADDMIVSAGYNISGPEVEQALIAHPLVKEVAVVAKRDYERETNFVKAFVVPADPAAVTPQTADELREFCKAQLAPFKAPREIEFVASLPRTETGKLQRYKLRT